MQWVIIVRRWTEFGNVGIGEGFVWRLREWYIKCIVGEWRGSVL
jgi:hypothetical protein